MDAAMYLRKSRQDEETENPEETLFRHRVALEEYALANKITIVEVYEEVVSGGYLYARPQMLRLLSDVEQCKFDAVLCMDIDRLGRGSMSDQGYILETLKASHTLIITPRKTYDLNNDLDETYSEFETFMARQELKTISRRLQRGLHKTIADGGYVANAPYGYRKTTINKRPTLEIYEPEAKFVRMMYEWYANERMGCQLIADRLNAMGSVPHRAREWGRTSVMRILRSPVYDGKIVWDRVTHIRKGRRGNQKHIQIYNPREKWTITEGLHPALIEHTLFDQVQEIFASRYHSPSNDGTVVNPLAGIIICAHCRAPMQRMLSKGVPYLICVRKGCMVSSRLDLVEHGLIDALSSVRKELVLSDGEHQNPHDDSAEAALRAELRTVQTQLDKLHDLLEQGVYDTQTFISRRTALADRMQNIEHQLTLTEQPKRLNRKAMADRITDIIRLYDDSEPSARNFLLKSCVDKVVYDRKKGSKPGDFSLDVQLIPLYIE